MGQPFEIVFQRTLVPGPDGYSEEQCLTLSFGEAMLEVLGDLDPLALKALVALALSVRPLAGREYQELARLGVVGAEDRGRLAAVVTSVELGRAIQADRRTADRRCGDLAERGWLAIRDLPQGQARGRFSGGRVYFLSAGKIVYTPQKAPEDARADLQIEQRNCPSPCTRDVHGDGPEEVAPPTVYTGCTGGVHGVHTEPAADVHGGPPMERKHGKGARETRTSAPAAVFVAPAVEAQAPQPPEQSDGPAPGLLAVLDYFVGRVAERWPTAAGRGPSPARAIAQRYGIARSLLLAAATPDTVARAKADVVEELLVLSQVLRDLGPVELASAIDRALQGEGRGPVHRLAYAWPVVPGAKGLQWALKQNLRAGGRLPDGGGYREARRLFVLLNRCDVGPGLLEQFLVLCRELGVGPVQVALEQALAAGRAYVTLAFLREAVRRQGASGGRGGASTPADADRQAGRPGTAPVGPALDRGASAGTLEKAPAAGERPDAGAPTPAGAAAEPEANPAPATAAPGTSARPAAGPARGDSLAGGGAPGDERASDGPENGLVRFWLREYGIVGAPLEELAQRAGLAQVRAWMLYLEHQERMDDEARRGTLVNRLRAGDEPPRRYRWWALLLPPLDPVEEAMLEEDYQERRWGSGAWPEDVLEVIGAERAEQWLEARGKRPALER